MGLEFISEIRARQSVQINPVHAILWTLRRNEHDVINLYTSLSPVMQLATGGNMLNFGYWNARSQSPITAQNELCLLVSDIAELGSAKKMVDVGSGLSAPALYWKSSHSSLDIICVNINLQQLLHSRPSELHRLNATSSMLPFSDESVDRVVALESAQHFRPLENFVKEAKRILDPAGLLVLAIPVMTSARPLLKLGILAWTWSSEHYDLEHVKFVIVKNGFMINEIRCIGRQVYEPMTDYYVINRKILREKILTMYPSVLEKVLYRSLLKMRQVSKKGVIDYVIIKASMQR